MTARKPAGRPGHVVRDELWLRLNDCTLHRLRVQVGAGAGADILAERHELPERQIDFVTGRTPADRYRVQPRGRPGSETYGGVVPGIVHVDEYRSDNVVPDAALGAFMRRAGYSNADGSDITDRDADRLFEAMTGAQGRDVPDSGGGGLLPPMQRLTQRQRDVVEARLTGASWRDVGELLGADAGNCKKTFDRAIARLRQNDNA